MTQHNVALITGASSGIGALYAERLARRGHDLILVARQQQRLAALAKRLHSETGRNIEVLAADLGKPDELALVEALLRRDARISTVVNNAGIGATAPLLDSDVDKLTALIDLNVTALTRLTYAAVPGLVARGGGTLINIASIVAIAPELLNGVYGASKAYVLALSQSLRKELQGTNVRVQVVLPGATATAFWEQAGLPLQHLPEEIVMDAATMVDAALRGLDQGEFITIPSLPSLADLDSFEHARQHLLPQLSAREPAARYR